MHTLRSWGWLLFAFSFLVPVMPAMAATKPLPPPQVCIGTKCVQSITATTTTAVKWHPGWYLEIGSHIRGLNTIQYAPTQSDWNALPSTIKGMNLHISWVALEPTLNNFRLQWLHDQVAMAKSVGKRVYINFWPQAIGSNTSFPTDVLPQYLRSSPYGDYQSDKVGPVAKFWRQNEADRIIAVMKAVCADFDTDPNFEGIMLMETAYSPNAPVDSAFSGSAVVTQLKRILEATRNACPHTLVSSRANWGTSSDMISIAQQAVNLHIGIGSTDADPTWITDMDKVLTGATGGVDYRGKIPIVAASEYVPFLKSTCATSLISYMKNTYGVTHAMLSAQEAWTGALSCQMWPATLSAISALGGATNTACPSSMTCDTK